MFGLSTPATPKCPKELLGRRRTRRDETWRTTAMRGGESASNRYGNPSWIVTVMADSSYNTYKAERASGGGVCEGVSEYCAASLALS